jgi:hypothetical protein
MTPNCHNSAGIAQMVEQLICNQQVPRSIRGAGTNNTYMYTYNQCGVAQLVERLTVNQLVVGSSPAIAANRKEIEK